MRLPTIRSSAQISSIFRTGERKGNKFLTLIVSKNIGEIDSDGSLEHGRTGRVAFIAGKKNGNACWRNTAKRRMREIARQLGGPWPGYDVLFVAKRGIERASYSKVLFAVKNTIENSGLEI